MPLLALVAGGLPFAACAQQAGNLDTRLRLDEGNGRREAQADARARADDQTDASSIEIDGARYSVGRNADDLGQALYLSIARKRWADARRFLDAYRALPDRDEALVLYADGTLARERGDVATALRDYRALVARQPGFLPGRLELARTLFLDHRDPEAANVFDDVRAELAGQGDKAAGVLRTVDVFRDALRKRRVVRGGFSIGPEYTSNLNQSSASYTCLLPGDDGDCLVDRRVPDRIAAAGINVEGKATWRLPLGGRNGIGTRALFFGDIFPGNGAYSQTALSLYAGYDRRTARTGLVLAPSFDIGTLGSHRLYDAWGGHGEYSLTLGGQGLVRLEANLRDFDYHLDGYRDFAGRQADVALTGWYTLPHGWSVFGGPDALDKRARDPVNGYRQYGGRLGVDKMFGGTAELLLTGSLRRRDYRRYSALLDATRHDTERNYTLLVRLPGLRLAGFSPSVLAQHGRTASNVDWLYSYRRSSISLRIDHVF